MGNKEKEIVKPKDEKLSSFEPSGSVLNQMRTDENKNFKSTRVFVDDEGKSSAN